MTQERCTHWRIAERLIDVRCTREAGHPNDPQRKEHINGPESWNDAAGDWWFGDRGQTYGVLSAAEREALMDACPATIYASVDDHDDLFAAVERIIADRMAADLGPEAVAQIRAEALREAALAILADCADFDSYSGKADDFCGYCERAALLLRARADRIEGA